MKFKTSLIAVLSLVLAISAVAEKKKKPAPRGILESMQAVPCGAKERGVTGLGSMVASLGVEHVNSHEQLCPQYLLRTDDIEYHIRPLDTKHAAVLPVGHEAEYRVKKDRLYLRVVDGEKKTTVYQVVAMQPTNSGSEQNSAYHPPDTRKDDKPMASRAPANSGANPPRGVDPPNQDSKPNDPPSDHPQL
ncbi:MAG: hypothetical protein WB566_20105 [Terriglobales bacterium]